ncbi:hypothetical protein BDV29DRAFT_173466 [Aspergillus leporis]|uniref:Uncharacterized protein n=1 Tax=Aspergillus leporis TaxID=41062 RepID=A0A5N5X1C0_9EURO|nr:hypothetical protein BDV29DRAFT_173466 [Aspergillus leporis]
MSHRRWFESHRIRCRIFFPLAFPLFWGDIWTLSSVSQWRVMWKERVLLAEDVQEVRAARPPTLSTGYFMYCYFFQKDRL